MLIRYTLRFAHLDEPGLALSHEHAVKVELFVGELYLRRGDVGLEKHYRLRTVLNLNWQLQRSDAVGEPLSVVTCCTIDGGSVVGLLSPVQGLFNSIGVHIALM